MQIIIKFRKNQFATTIWRGPPDYGTTIKSLHTGAVTTSSPFYLKTESFRLLPRKLLWKKQTFLGLTEGPLERRLLPRSHDTSYIINFINLGQLQRLPGKHKSEIS